jgi:hypothetical protein
MRDSAWERKTESLERTSTCAVSKYGERAPSVFFGWLQVTDSDGFVRFFLCHFILLSRWFGLP